MARSKNRFNAVNKKEAGNTIPSRCWRTALYARLSVENLGRPSESIANQLELLRRFVKDKAEFSEYFEYTDSGFSGTNFRRPAFEQMMEDVRKGKINCIIVKDLSRLGRDYLETSNFIETIFPFLEVRFISVNDHFDTSDKYNTNKELEVALKNLVNDMYARDVSKRISVSRTLDQNHGKFVGSNAPYGYKVNEEHPLRQFMIDEPAAQVVRNIFEMAMEGMTLREISRTLQKQKLSVPGQYAQNGHLHLEPGDKPCKWYIGSISNILHNQSYIGNMVQGKRRSRLFKGETTHFTEKEEWIICENTHEAIVSREIFEEVQKKLQNKVTNSSFSSDRTKNIPIKPNRFKGLLYCGICGEKLSYASSVMEDKQSRNYYFQCNTNYDLAIKDHTGIRITEQTLEDILKEMTEKVLSAYENRSANLITVMEKELKKRTKGWEKDVRKTKLRLQSLDADLASRYESYVTGTLTREDYLKVQKDVEKDRAKMEEEIRTIQEKIASCKADVQNRIRWLLGLEEAVDRELDSELLHLLIERIDLYPHHEIQITWRFSKEDINNLWEE